MTHLSLSDRRAIDELKKERERLFSEASSQRLASLRRPQKQARGRPNASNFLQPIHVELWVPSCEPSRERFRCCPSY